MPLTPLEKEDVASVIKLADAMVATYKPLADKIDALYNPANTGHKFTVTQDGLDAVQSFQGLTKQELDDAVYALAGTMKTAFDAAYVAISKLAARAKYIS